MKKQVPQKSYYELKEMLGEGLTSEVYRAFRVDQKAWTRQLVALKIIKSEKDVQILKLEFDKLLKVQSKYCVQVIAWENLPKGPAIVMEYIEGVTLHELLSGGAIAADLVEEIFCQVTMGLKALHRSDVVHGDLNLKNILITTKGVVKLIDFGFFSEGKSLVTPEFASPKLLNGGQPSAESDFFALNKIRCFLMPSSGAEVESSVGSSKASRRRMLAQLVRRVKNKNSQSTQVINRHSAKKRTKKLWGPLLLATSCFLFFMGFPILFESSPDYGTLEVKGEKWVRVSINGLPEVYGPIVDKKLRKGAYKIRWETADNRNERSVSIEKGQTFLLKP